MVFVASRVTLAVVLDVVLAGWVVAYVSGGVTQNTESNKAASRYRFGRFIAFAPVGMVGGISMFVCRNIDVSLIIYKNSKGKSRRI